MKDKKKKKEPKKIHTKAKVMEGLKLGKSLKAISKRTGFSVEEIRGFQTEALRDRETFLQDSVLEMTDLVSVAKSAYRARPNGGSGAVVSDFIRLRAHLIETFNSLVDTAEYYDEIEQRVLHTFKVNLMKSFVDGMRSFLDDADKAVPSTKSRQRIRKFMEDVMMRFAQQIDEVYDEARSKTADILGVGDVMKQSTTPTKNVSKAKKKKPQLRVVDGGI